MDEYLYLDEGEEQYWRERPHSWADVVTARKRKLNPQSENTGAEKENDQQNITPSLNPDQTPEQQSAPAPPTLHLRGGGRSNRRKLKDDEPLPSLSWWLAGGQGAPPTAGSYNKWRDREKGRIAEENKKTGRKGEGRGFWREMCWVLGGAKAAEYERRRGKKGGTDAAAGAADGGVAAGGAAADGAAAAA